MGIFNRAVREGSYPDVLKVTKVVELYKGGDVEEATQYRPISLLPIIAKLIDKLINTQLMKHLVENNIISHTQYAFRPNSNTTMALQTILTDIHRHRKRASSRPSRSTSTYQMHTTPYPTRRSCASSKMSLTSRRT